MFLKGLFKKIFVTFTFLAPVPVAVQLTEAFASFLHLSLHKRFCVSVKRVNKQTTALVKTFNNP